MANHARSILLQQCSIYHHLDRGGTQRQSTAEVRASISEKFRKQRASLHLIRFVQVETAFFWMWWKETTDQRRQDFIDLVESGQIEMIGGAWSMNDEACANYQSTIDQFTWGLR